MNASSPPPTETPTANAPADSAAAPYAQNAGRTISGGGWLLRVIVVFFALLAFMQLMGQGGGVPEGTMLPDFSRGQWINAQAADFSPDAIGRDPVVLDFFRTDCPPCIAGLAKLHELQDIYRDDGVRVVLVSSEPAGRVAAFVARHGVELPVLIDPPMFSEMNVRVVPTAVVFDRHGQLAYEGNPSHPDFKAIVDAQAKYQCTH